MASEPPRSGPCGLGVVLAQARRLIRRGDAWEAEDYDRLRRDCDAIEIRGEPDITVALRKSLQELTVNSLRRRDDLGYGDLCEGHVLYQAVWRSEYLQREMYLKFSLFDNRLIIVSFHESR